MCKKAAIVLTACIVGATLAHLPATLAVSISFDAGDNCIGVAQNWKQLLETICAVTAEV